MLKLQTYIKTFAQGKGFSLMQSSFRIPPNYSDKLLLNDVFQPFTSHMYIIQLLIQFFFESHITAELKKKIPPL